MIKPFPYSLNAFNGMLRKLMRRFDFLDWNEIKLFGFLSVYDAEKIMQFLDPLSNKYGCFSMPIGRLTKKLAKELKVGRNQSKQLVHNLCNENYARLIPPIYSMLNEETHSDKNDLTKIIIELDGWAGPYEGRKALPFINVKGFVFTSLWLMQYLIVSELFERTKKFSLQRGLSLEDFVESNLRDQGFKTKKASNGSSCPQLKIEVNLRLMWQPTKKENS